ncbi:tyrosine-type recombinase/integrase [Moritella sp. 5]|nr:tyrosine-type recombinase/integrase [Moritella sp. 5]QUM82023.1 tyrosine-type recombinase/integrase [Moritella sp. 5]
MSHVLRHTFANHFMINGGNILVLQRILGHASIVDAMKYSYFTPEY